MAGAESFQTAIDYIALTLGCLDEAIGSLPTGRNGSSLLSTLTDLRKKLIHFQTKLLSPSPQEWNAEEDYHFLKEIEDNLFLVSGRNVEARPPFQKLSQLTQVRYATLPTMILFQLDNAGIRTHLDAHIFLSTHNSDAAPPAISLATIGKRTIQETQRLECLATITSVKFSQKYRSNKARAQNFEYKTVDRKDLEQYTEELAGSSHPYKQHLSEKLKTSAQNSDLYPFDEILEFVFKLSDEHAIPRLNVYQRDLCCMLALIAKRNPTQKPITLFEVGTLVGYSSIGLMMGLPKGSKIITCEINPLHYLVACENIREAERRGLIPPGSIEVRYGDALQTIEDLNKERIRQKQLGKTFALDVAFYDADKQAERYVEALRPFHPSIQISDNTTRRGRVANPQITDDFAIDTANRALSETQKTFGTFLEKEDGDNQLVIVTFSEEEIEKLLAQKECYLKEWPDRYGIKEEDISKLQELLLRLTNTLLNKEQHIDDYEIIRFLDIRKPPSPNFPIAEIFIGEMYKKFFSGDSGTLSSFLKDELPQSLPIPVKEKTLCLASRISSSQIVSKL